MLREGPLHASIKDWCARPGDRAEVRDRPLGDRPRARRRRARRDADRRLRPARARSSTRCSTAPDADRAPGAGRAAHPARRRRTARSSASGARPGCRARSRCSTSSSRSRRCSRTRTSPSRCCCAARTTSARPSPSCCGGASATPASGGSSRCSTASSCARPPTRSRCCPTSLRDEPFSTRELRAVAALRPRARAARRLLPAGDRAARARRDARPRAAARGGGLMAALRLLPDRRGRGAGAPRARGRRLRRVPRHPPAVPRSRAARATRARRDDHGRAARRCSARSRSAPRTSPAPCRRRWGPPGSSRRRTTSCRQSVPHLHVHVVPRNRKDGLRGFFWPRTTYDSDEQAAEVAERIRSKLVQ